MAEIPVTQDEIMAVYPKLAETMADALGCDVEDIKPDVSLIEGLDAESIDFRVQDQNSARQDRRERTR